MDKPYRDTRKFRQVRRKKENLLVHIFRIVMMSTKIQYTLLDHQLLLLFLLKQFVVLISVKPTEVEHEDNVVLDTTFPVFSCTVSYSKLTTIDDIPLTTLPKQNPHKSRSKPTGNLIR